MKNNNQKTIYIIICTLCVVCITITGAILLKIQSVNNSQIIIAESIVSESKMTTRVNINTAPKSELMLLENIGSKKADDIIAYRKLKSFEKPEDLMNVSGIGKKTYERIKDFICVK